MGAISIERTGYGPDIRTAFRYVQEGDRREYGEDSYNGASNHCHLVKDVTSEWKNYKGKQHDFINNLISRANKREMYGFCVKEPKANTNKTKSVVNSHPNKGTRKWVTKYVARNKWEPDAHVGISADTQTECIKKARAFVEKNPNVKLEIYVTKELAKGQALCAEVMYKSSSTERDGEYIFVGMAPY